MRHETMVPYKVGTAGKKLGLTLKNRKLVWAGPESDITITRAFLIELMLWVPYILALLSARGRAAISISYKPTLGFWPTQPRPWYLIAGAAAWGGVRVLPTSHSFANIMYFEDLTEAGVSCDIPTNAINGRCIDIRKSHVAAVFETVFGYPLAVNPRIYSGPIIEKPETNGVHAGRIVRAPLLPVEGYVYQKLIDTADAHDQCHDLRTPCIGGRPVMVWRKIKAPSDRFAIQNQSAKLLTVEEVFSQAEVSAIVAFNLAIGLECGGLDILRDQNDGRIYIVDVNKTDMGPLIALRWREKMASMKLLGQALRTWLIVREQSVDDTLI